MAIEAFGSPALPILFGEPASRPSWMPIAFPDANEPELVPSMGVASGIPTIVPKPPGPPPQSTPLFFDQRTTISPWFDNMHVLPRRIDLGRVLATTNIPMTVHNAHRDDTVTWNSFVNGAGAGTALTGPTPPQILAKQESTIGLVLVITTDGVPVVDNTLDFGFTPTGDLILVPISFSRLVFFPIFPQEGFTEDIGFLTDVLVSKNGTEKRSALRRFPRIRYALKFREESVNTAYLHNLLLGRPGATYGIPLWHESTKLTVATAADDIIINVQDTKYRQFRVDGVGVIYVGEYVFDIFQIQSFTDTTITPVNPLALDVPAGARVMPVRLATTGNRQRGSRFPVELANMDFAFDVRDIEEDLADLTEWGAYNGKPLIDDCNNLGRSNVQESVEAPRLVILDNETGPVQQFSYAPNARFATVKQWAPQGIKKLWEVRELVYALHGQQVAFYMPTDREDFEPLVDLVIADDLLIVRYVSYNSTFGNKYRDHIRVTLTDGTVYTREVIAVTQNEAQTEETLQLDDDWPANIPIGDIARIEFLQVLRLATDTIRFRYEPGKPGARVPIPVIAVLDE